MALALVTSGQQYVRNGVLKMHRYVTVRATRLLYRYLERSRSSSFPVVDTGFQEHIFSRGQVDLEVCGNAGVLNCRVHIGSKDHRERLALPVQCMSIAIVGEQLHLDLARAFTTGHQLQIYVGPANHYIHGVAFYRSCQFDVLTRVGCARRRLRVYRSHPNSVEDFSGTRRSAHHQRLQGIQKRGLSSSANPLTGLALDWDRV